MRAAPCNEKVLGFICFARPSLRYKQWTGHALDHLQILTWNRPDDDVHHLQFSTVAWGRSCSRSSIDPNLESAR